MQRRLKQSQTSLQKLTRPSFLLFSKVTNGEKGRGDWGDMERDPPFPPLPLPSSNLVLRALFPGFGGAPKAREKRPGDEVAPPLLTPVTQANRRYCPGQSDFARTMNKVIRSRTKYIFVADDKPGKTPASNMISTVGFYF